MAVNRIVAAAGIAAFALLSAGLASAQYIGDAPPPLPAPPLGPESAANSLARNVRILVQDPRNYNALVGAGRAALATDDPEAAVDFFGRASDIAPRAAAPRAGLAAALVALGDAARALEQFSAAQKLGASVTSIAADRGLARDLLGQQSLAQADYRLALNGPDAAEARRRLALSLAISGDRVGAQMALAPLLQNSDVATNRVRAFILAIGGDAAGAGRALDRTMPGMSTSLDPFFRRLPGLTPAQKAAAVHFGIFPGSGTPATMAGGILPNPAPPGQGAPLGQGSSPRSSFGLQVDTEDGNRLAGIDALLRNPEPPSAVVPTPPPAPRPQYEGAARASAAVAPAPSRTWVQLASGTDETALGAQFKRIAAKSPEIFRTIRPFVVQANGKSKLLVGPFKNDDDSAIFVENLADADIAGFSWTSPAGQVVRKLATP